VWGGGVLQAHQALALSFGEDGALTGCVCGVAAELLVCSEPYSPKLSVAFWTPSKWFIRVGSAKCFLQLHFTHFL
jgi:hypothetical protein